MPIATHLRIDTSIASAGPSSSRAHSSRDGLSPRPLPTPASTGSTSSIGRIRTLSSASSSSAVSAISTTSRAPSSASHLSAHSAYRSIPTTPTSPSASSRPAPSPAWHTIDSGSEDDAIGNTDEYVLAMHDFAPQQPNVTCLSFRAGQVIHVLNRDSSGWWDGELEGRRGWFPSNYVTSEVGLLTDEELPGTKNPRLGHKQNLSVSSTTSWASNTSRNGKSAFARNDHRPTAADSFGPTIDMYCPQLMVPLLRALSLLQNAVRMNRVHHFQPATACIISCVRALLSEIGCLSRDAPILKQHGVLAQERKRILSDLASLVSQAKRASDDAIVPEETRDMEIQAMVRLAGQLFAHVRGFLAVAVQCGVNLPSAAARTDPESSQLQLDRRWDPRKGALSSQGEMSEDDFATPGRTANGIAMRARRNTDAANTPSRPKSLGDLKMSKRAAMGADYPPMPVGNFKVAQRKLSEQQLTSPSRRTFSEGTPRQHRPAQDSISSDSSSSSFSSDSVGTPATPVFPSGPATTAEVMDALRHTHDNFLSTIAAFIGHAHSHSRNSHASSTGHMYDLVREVVDMVCRLLTIVEAVLRHPDIPPAKADGLRAAKEGLYNVTSTLADSVRLLTAPPAADVSEEAEKEQLLRCATDALKAGSDCVNAVKKCLQRATGERPFVFTLPTPGEHDPESGVMVYTPRKFGHAHRPSTASARSVRSAMSVRSNGPGPRIRRASSLRVMHGLFVEGDGDGEEEDVTIQAQGVDDSEHTMRVKRMSDATIPIIEQPPSPTPSPGADVEAEAETEGGVGSEPPTPVTPSVVSPILVEKALPEPRPSLDRVTLRSDAMSLNSYAPTEDDRTTWEGSQRHGAAPSTTSFEQQLLNGELPAIPGTHPFGAAVLPWTFPHDHAPEDVAYNSDGQLVGATLEALVERMTPHDALVEPPFAAVFFMTFRLFTTPAELLDSVIARYNILPPPGLLDADLRLWQQRKGLPVRLRVSNFIKTWVETYWRHATDAPVVPTLVSFIRDALAAMFPGPSQRILELVHQRVAAGSGDTLSPRADRDRMRDAGMPLNPPTLPGAHLGGPEADHDEDGAMTVMECFLYCAIQPEEVLETGSRGARTKDGVVQNGNGWVAESILNEPDTKRRTALVKFFIKLADRCLSLRNYSTPRSILAALDSSTIARLHQTWTGLSQKSKLQLEALRKLADHARNYHEYRSRLRNTAPPAVPFLGLYLTDITFCREGNPSHRTSPKSLDKKLLNFNKYHKLARIVQDMQRFQVPYNLKEIPEVQVYLRDAFEKSQRQGDLQDLYRRSLLVEPKQSAEPPPSSDVPRQLFAWASRSQQSMPAAPAS
ncbi:ras GEF [Ganoderma leucocontextum]|nr:ras GEF [Ganoderma leucocontextum]